MKIILIFTVLIYLVNAHAKYSNLQNYSKKDLAILVTQKEYQEFFAHAKDIRPTLRDQQWEKNVTLMGQEFLKSVIFREELSSKMNLQVDKLLKWPKLSQNSSFHQLYDKFKITYYSQKSSLTPEEIEQFWSLSTQTPKSAFELVKILSTRGHFEYQISKLLLKISNGSVSTFYCRDRNIQKLLFKSLKKTFMSDPASLAVEQTRLLNKECLKEWSGTLISELSRGELSDKILRFKILKSNKLISAAEEEDFLFDYFMNTPYVGDTLNYAWAFITKLGSDYPLRKRFLNKIEKRRFLPGKLFALQDVKRRIPLLNHLNQNFPEYIDTYLSTCLAFFEGKKEFPFGNPTLECRNFMTKKENYRFIPIGFLNRHRSSLYSWK